MSFMKQCPDLTGTTFNRGNSPHENFPQGVQWIISGNNDSRQRSCGFKYDFPVLWAAQTQFYDYGVLIVLICLFILLHLSYSTCFFWSFSISGLCWKYIFTFIFHTSSHFLIKKRLNKLRLKWSRLAHKRSSTQVVNFVQGGSQERKKLKTVWSRCS